MVIKTDESIVIGGIYTLGLIWKCQIGYKFEKFRLFSNKKYSKLLFAIHFYNWRIVSH